MEKFKIYLIIFMTVNIFSQARNLHSMETTIPGWPSDLAMGTVTNNSEATEQLLCSAPVDAIFKYAGNDGGGDQGQILEPTTTEKTILQARSVEKVTERNVMPVMVVYTIDASGGLWKAGQDVLDKDNLMKHYVNLIRIANKCETFRDDIHQHPASLILNPDFLGMMQQQKDSDLARQISEGAIQVNAQLKTAVEYVTEHDHISCQTIPPFTDDLKGYIQSINWTIQEFGPHISFGWQENIWPFQAGANWIHQDYSDAELKDKITGNVVSFIENLEVYSGEYQPHFLVFDKYERDGLGSEARPVGYCWNGRDWNNYLRYVGNISEGLNIPAILWQIPGGHMVGKNEVSVLDINLHSANAPDYILGDTTIGHDLSNINAKVLDLDIPSSIYQATTVGEYLAKDQGVDWGQSHLQDCVSSNVKAILWGGGSTTGVVSIVTNGDDGGWLSKKLQEYYKDPQPLQSGLWGRFFCF